MLVREAMVVDETRYSVQPYSDGAKAEVSQTASEGG